MEMFSNCLYLSLLNETEFARRWNMGFPLLEKPQKGGQARIPQRHRENPAQ